VTSVTASLVGEGMASIIAGRGGDAERDGGAGGSIQKINLFAENSEGVYLQAGDGGNSRGGHGLAFAGAGGAGGNISKLSVKSTDATGNIDRVEAFAGAGGNASYGYRYTYSNGEGYTTALGAKGGAGGSVKSIVISNLVAKSLEILGGSGGDSTYKFDGSSGGSVSRVTAVVADLVESSITGGSGGKGSSEYGASNGPDGKVIGINVTQVPAEA